MKKIIMTTLIVATMAASSASAASVANKRYYEAGGDLNHVFIDPACHDAAHWSTHKEKVECSIKIAKLSLNILKKVSADASLAASLIAIAL